MLFCDKVYDFQQFQYRNYYISDLTRSIELELVKNN